ncbi:hypothetical protein [Burkholderia sp. BCC0419]|uniref:hypothetical protein n=1 Tax=Burkholderia sp. BCC0419 TaxID=486878 RepID=UPI00158E51F4|nr:hypothetical protein [Burkholderia sp. BCC0419]
MPLMEWSIEASRAWSKINLSGRMGRSMIRNKGSRIQKNRLKSPQENKKLHSTRAAAAIVDLLVGVFPRTCSFLFYSWKVTSIITIHKLLFRIWNKSEQAESRSEGRVRDV